MYLGYLHAGTNPSRNWDWNRARRRRRAGSGTASGIKVESGLGDLGSGVIPLQRRWGSREQWEGSGVEEVGVCHFVWCCCVVLCCVEMRWMNRVRIRGAFNE